MLEPHARFAMQVVILASGLIVLAPECGRVASTFRGVEQLAQDAAPNFEADIAPILSEKCSRCHNPRKQDGGLDLSSPATMLRGGKSGAAFVKGNSKKSLMIDMIFFDEMPPKRERTRVSRAELKLLEVWIDAGAPSTKRDR